jgi:hypothetical protein
MSDSNNAIFKIELNPAVRQIGCVPIISPGIIDNILALISIRGWTADRNYALLVNISRTQISQMCNQSSSIAISEMWDPMM